MRLLIVISILALFLIAQQYWFRTLWRFAGHMRRQPLRRLLRAVMIAAFGSVVALLLVDAFLPRRDLIWRYAGFIGIVGLWVTTAFWSYLAVKSVEFCGWLVSVPGKMRRSKEAKKSPESGDNAGMTDESRRGFLKTATIAAGALPF